MSHTTYVLHSFYFGWPSFSYRATGAVLTV